MLRHFEKEWRTRWKQPKETGKTRKMTTILAAASMILTKDDLEVMDECLSSQLRTLRNKVFTTWKDKKYYDKVKALKEHVEKTLDSFTEIEALREEE